MNLYDPLLERDEAGIRAAIHEFRGSHTSGELSAAIARFAVLVYAPSQHGKHAMICCLSAYEAREQLGDRYDDTLAECAIYAAASRQPWSEPPITVPPPLAPGQRGDLEELRECVDTSDRLRAERWLAKREADADLERDLFVAATDDFEDLGHKLIVAVTASKLAAIFGGEARYATLRTAIWEMTAYRGPRYIETGREADAQRLIDNMVASCGDVISAQAVFLLDAALQTGQAEVIRRVRDYLDSSVAGSAAVTLPAGGPAATSVYRLARDYGAYLKSLSVAKRLGDERIIAAARYNLDHAPSFEDFGLA